MVQLIRNGLASLHASGADSRGFISAPRPDYLLSREEHRMRELNLHRDSKRAPRRSQTHHNYQVPQGPTMTLHTIRQQPELAEEKTGDDAAAAAAVEVQGQLLQRPSQGAPRRPTLGPPRRSYSVMDCEPIPHHHRLSTRMTLLDLPSEMHFTIFDFLDPIDSTCLGLTNKHFYAIHRRMHGTVPLTARRDGPNELEWAWHLAGAVVRAPPSSLNSEQLALLKSLEEKDKHALSKLRVRGQAYCRKCGVTRCELHKHIESWMGEGMEYCSVKQKFGAAAGEGARPYCYMSKPSDPHRCGRHYVKKSTVVLK
ncbi:hypothetical protein GQ53DRAFT_266963 [Thozetella sp. PMI_491]|nr:hypothetical protein GQ53DRAFT_266963 [Thozetella sp. PMI_491]